MKTNNTLIKGKSLFKFLKNYVVVDIETTGLNNITNDIIEIGAIKVINNKVVEELSLLIKIDTKIPYNIIKLTGIDNEMLKEDGIDIKEALMIFDNFINDFVIVGHNVKFDLGFLCNNYNLHLNKELTNDYIDTLLLSRKLVKDSLNYKLVTLAQKFNIDNFNAHRALNDVYVTNALYNVLRKLSLIR